MLKNGNATFSWRELVSDKPLTDGDRRAFIEFKPVLDFNALEPGKEATDAIRQAATDLNLDGEYGARVRLTGPVPIANEEFATVPDGAVVNGIGTVLVVLFILWMALHSAKIISAVFTNLFIGLSITTALGLMMVGSFNLLSIAFAVLFVGLGVDFGIQFSVRYRSERLRATISRRHWRRRPNVSRCRCRSPRWRPRPDSCRSCRPTIKACRNSARSPASACWWRFSRASPYCRPC